MGERGLEKLAEVIKTTFGVSPYPYQTKFIFDCLKNQRVAGHWCRQTGKSTSIAIFSILYTLLNPKKQVLIVAPTDEQAGELFEKIRGIISMLNEREKIVDMLTKRQVLFKNKSMIRAMTTGDKGTSIRGKTADVLLIEEAAFIKQSIYDEVLRPLLLATKGKIIEVSTPFGKGGFFYNHCSSSDWSVHHLPWTEAVKYGAIDEKEVLRAKEETNSLAFAAEYEAIFIESARNYFTHDELKECIDSIYQPIEERNLINEKDRPNDGEYYLGVDLARLGQDSTVFIVIRKGDQKTNTPHRVCFIHQLPKGTIDAAVDYAKWLHEKFKFRKIYADMTGLGAGFVDFLAKELNNPKYKKTVTTTFNPKPLTNDVVTGVTFTIKQKMDMYSYLKLLIQQKMIRYPNHSKLLWELQQFEYEIIEGSRNIKLHHPDTSKGHDDFCDALALAVQGLRQKEGFIMFADEVTATEEEPDPQIYMNDPGMHVQ